MSQPILVRSLSDREARLLSALAAAGRTVFTIEEARQTSGADGADVARLLYRQGATSVRYRCYHDGRCWSAHAQRWLTSTPFGVQDTWS